MPSYKAVYSGDYLKADDIYGKRLLVTVDKVALTQVHEDDAKKKLVVAFVGKKAKLVLNKTNATKLGKLFGEDYDGWVGRPIILFTIDDAFEGKPGIRIDPAPPGTVGTGAEAPPIPQPVIQEEESFSASDDDVPFVVTLPFLIAALGMVA